MVILSITLARKAAGNARALKSYASATRATAWQAAKLCEQSRNRRKETGFPGNTGLLPGMRTGFHILRHDNGTLIGLIQPKSLPASASS